MKIPIAQKFGVAGIFSVACIDVTMDILRTVYTDQKLDASLNIVWDLLEPSIAVIVCAIPTYRALFTNARKREAIRANSYKHLGERMNSRPNEQEHQLATLRSSDKNPTSITTSTHRHEAREVGGVLLGYVEDV